MVSINPNSGDLFYLRMLLRNRAGPTSFEDLRTVDGVIFPDFKGACIAMGLCEDDSQWIEAMKEAVEISTPFVIRQLFANILLHCNPTDPKAIFDEFSDAMKEDFVHKRAGVLNLILDEINRLALNDLLSCLNTIFEDNGKSNESFGMSMPEDLDDVEEIFDEAEFDPDAESFFQDSYSLLNDEQRDIFETLKVHLDNDEGGLYNFDAPGGSGKTFLANVILAYVRKEGKVALAMALSVGGALENLSPANLLPCVNWYLLSLLQLQIRFNSELTPISDTLPSRSSTAPISNFAIERSTLKSILVQSIADPSNYQCKISRW
jgi:hypothetical protein